MSDGSLRKLIVFTEHRDTLNYLVDRLRTLLGRPEAVVTIHGGVRREERRKIEEAFTQDKDVWILVATDAAGEGINLQRAHLVINYDLPWNPNRIEQRFGRVHRIGQTEVCHLWNLVARDTREGEVFHRLFEKLEQQRRTSATRSSTFSAQLSASARFAICLWRRSASAINPRSRRGLIGWLTRRLARELRSLCTSARSRAR